MSGTVWLCCRCKDVVEHTKVEINGVFSTRELAITACTSWRDWIVPLAIDVRLPEETVEMTEAEWPRIHERPQGER